MNDNITTIAPFEQTSEFILYTTPNGVVQIEAFVKDETIWLTQKLMAELFDVDRTSISRHLKNIFESGELLEEVVCADFAHTTQHGAIEGNNI